MSAKNSDIENQALFLIRIELFWTTNQLIIKKQPS